MEDLAYDVALASSCGLVGDIDARLATWLFKAAKQCGSEQADEVLKTLEAAIRGDSGARLKLTRHAVAFWEILDRGVGSDGERGFIFNYSKSFPNDHEISLARAAFLYENGKSGDERIAVDLVVSAALAGSKKHGICWLNGGSAAKQNCCWIHYYGLEGPEGRWLRAPVCANRWNAE